MDKLEEKTRKLVGGSAAFTEVLELGDCPEPTPEDRAIAEHARPGILAVVHEVLEQELRIPEGLPRMSHNYEGERAVMKCEPHIDFNSKLHQVRCGQEQANLQAALSFWSQEKLLKWLRAQGVDCSDDFGKEGAKSAGSSYERTVSNVTMVIEAIRQQDDEEGQPLKQDFHRGIELMQFFEKNGGLRFLQTMVSGVLKPLLEMSRHNHALLMSSLEELGKEFQSVTRHDVEYLKLLNILRKGMETNSDDGLHERIRALVKERFEW